MNEYRLTTTRGADGNYLTNVTYNGQRVVSEVSKPVARVICEAGIGNINVLADNNRVSKIEIVLSGEDLI